MLVSAQELKEQPKMNTQSCPVKKWAGPVSAKPQCLGQSQLRPTVLKDMPGHKEGSANSFCERSDGKYFGLVGHMAPVATTDFCQGSVKAIDNTVAGFQKPLFTKTAAG